MSLTVLVVEDEMNIAGALADILIDAGHNPVAVNGPAALATARSIQPDVVLLDLAMPPPDGEAVAGQLRADPGTAAIPIVLMSAHHHRAREAAARIGAAGCLLKPFDIDDLVCTIVRAAS